MPIVDARVAVGAVLLGAAGWVFAQSVGEDADLNRIPLAPEAVSPPDASGEARAQRLRVEDAVNSWNTRTPVLPTPAAQATWQNRLSLDIDIALPLTDTLKFGFSNRLNVFAGSGLSPASRANVENDLREIYLSAALARRTYLDVGRLNLKQGVAYGFNPTDFFKTRTALQLSSIDPSAARENRLGTVMLKAQQLFDEGNVTLAMAPRVSHATPLVGSAPASFDPAWGRTNAENRALLSASWSASPFNPQLLVFRDGVGTHWGASVSRVLNASTVAYAEWSGVREASLAARAQASDAGRRFSNDLAVGASWTSSANLTLNAEYNYHARGLDESDLARAIGQGAAAQFWFMRRYAADQQEPFARRELFLRADWQDFIPSTLNVGAVAFIAKADGSALTQVHAQYFLSRRWTLSAYVGAATGATSSVFGSLPWRWSTVFQVARYF
ncbi:MAG: hypothetical protein V4508_15985 [Pseudomonadota bacterium]